MMRLKIAERELRSFRSDITDHIPMPNESCALAHVRLALAHIAMADLAMGAGAIPIPLPITVIEKFTEMLTANAPVMTLADIKENEK